MPDPNAHADDMTSPLKPEPMPPFWWLNPWSEALEWKRRAENGFAMTMKMAKKCSDQYAKYVRLAGEKLQIEADNLAAREALSKHFGEVIKTPLTLTANCREAGLLYGQFVRGHADLSSEVEQLRKDLADTAGAVANLKYSCEQHYKTAGNEIEKRRAAEGALADARDELKQAYENLEKVRKATGMVLEGDRLSMAGTVTRVEAVVQYLIDARDANTRLKEAGNEMRESRDRFAYALQHNAKLDQLNGPLIQKVSRAKRKVLAEDKTTGKKLLAPKAKKKGGSK